MTNDIIAKINEKIEERLKTSEFSDILIINQIENIKQDEYIKVILNESRKERFNTFTNIFYMLIDIFFVSSSKIDKNNMRDILFEIFTEDFEVLEHQIYIDEVEMDRDDEMLVCTLSISFYASIANADDSLPVIEELVYKE